ncbi:DMT family transporter [Roseitalea porphyridii]|uniref:DMT family transporter n=1 Tax=Roseitalea porphyridii TaxID=1852022 RepID=A0A4P6V4U0_9HYPH|nr:DMT family transporter [Roseitalea porphyridii]QBK31666.1 DMT family transporter [Roseitalea porphyridii]
MSAETAQSSNNRLAYVLLVLTTTFWGGNAVAGKLAVGHVSPMILTSLRWAIAVSILLVIAGPQFWADRRKVLRHLPLLFAYGATGFALFNITLYSALNYTTAINVAIWQAAIPMFIFLLNFIIFRTRITIAQMIGFILSVIGVAVVASGGSVERLMELAINFGDALMALAGLLYAGYSVGLRYKPDLHWKTMMVAMAFAAMVVSLPFAYAEWQSPAGIVPDARGWMVVLYTAIFPAIIAQVFFIRGVEMIGSNRAGLFVNLVPVIGTVLAILVLGEVFGLHHALALVLVIGGIWLAERKPARQR